MALAYLDDRTISTNGQNGVSGHQNSGLDYRTLNNGYRNDVSSDQIINIGRRRSTLVIVEPYQLSPKPLDDSSHQTTGTSHRSGDFGHQTTSTSCWSGYSGHRIGDLATRYFTKILKVKLFIIFYTGFYGQQKIFYKFDHILLANKYLKMGKHFPKKIFYFKTNSE